MCTHKTAGSEKCVSAFAIYFHQATFGEDKINNTDVILTTLRCCRPLELTWNRKYGTSNNNQINTASPSLCSGPVFIEITSMIYRFQFLFKTLAGNGWIILLYPGFEHYLFVVKRHLRLSTIKKGRNLKRQMNIKLPFICYQDLWFSVLRWVFVLVFTTF